MSFLLLKSKSRSSRSTTFRSKQFNQHSRHPSSGNFNNGDRNPSIAMKSQPTSNNHNDRRHPNMKEIHAGDGQVQLQRPRQSRRQVNTVQKQQQQNQASQQNSQQNSQQSSQQTLQNQNDVISMDEVMEDLRVLEQQQRDSQRLLASIKLTKQHKLEQRLSLESKLSSLKYSNGEARAQLQRARDVLSKSTRELGTAKLQSERSSDNLKRFDQKLRRTLSHVRGLHSKRRQVEQAIGKLRNANAVLVHRERVVAEQIKSKEMERDDAKHREKLLVHSIQALRRKVREFAEDTIKMRSDLSELESDLTISQQMEASTKFRVDTLKTECNNEHNRHEEAKAMILTRTKELNGEKMVIEKKIVEKTEGAQLKLTALTAAFRRCVSLQKEDGLEISTSPRSATINIDAIRSMVEDEESNLRVFHEEESNMMQKIEKIENRIKDLHSINEQINVESQKLQEVVIKTKENEETRKNDHGSFMKEFQKEQKELNELRKSVTHFQEENDREKAAAVNGESEQKSLLDEVRINLKKVQHEISNIDQIYHSKKTELENQLSTNKLDINEVNKRVNTKRNEFDSVQKLADDLKATSFNTSEEIINIETRGQNDLNSLSQERAGLIETFPCLSSLEIHYDEKKGRQEQIQNALFDLHNACIARIDAAESEKKSLLQEERTRLDREIAERAKIEEEAKIRHREELKIKVEEEERKRLEIEAEAEERHRAETLAKLQARKKAEAEERAHNRRLIERKKAEAENRARNRQLIEEKKRNREFIEGKTKNEGVDANKSNLDKKRNVYDIQSKKTVSRERGRERKPEVQKTKKKLAYELESLDYGVMAGKSVSMRKSKYKVIDSNQIREGSKEIKPQSSKRISKLSKSINDAERISSSKNKSTLSITGETEKIRIPREKESTKKVTKRMRSSLSDKKGGETTNKSSHTSKRRKKSSVQKLDIFSATEPVESKSRRATSKSTTSSVKTLSRSSDSRKDNVSRTRSSSQSKKPSQSQATVASRKSSSTTRRRKKVGSGSLGKAKMSQTTAADLDFSFM